MRIALVIERFEPRGGGVEAVAWQVAHTLAGTGDEVHVFCRAAPAPPGGGVVPHVLPVAARWQPWRVLAFSRAAAAATAGARCDVVHSFSRTRHQDVFRAGGGCHAAYMERQYGRAGAAWRRLTPRHAVLLGLEARVFSDPRQIVQCNSEMVRDELRRRFAIPDERLAVIANGVDLERFEPLRWKEAGGALRRSLDPGAERVWLLVGSGFRRKGLEVALRTLALRQPGEHLWVAGRDAAASWRDRARELGVLDRVRFLGLRDDLEAVYAAADALLLPTRYDAFANVCLEAAAMGLPVVTSAANGAAGWLGEACEAIAELDDPEPWARALESLGDPVERGRRGALARERARTASWDDHARALHALYERVRG